MFRSNSVFLKNFKTAEIPGVGNLSPGTQLSINADDVAAATRFGFYPRIGLDAGHFNFTTGYNIIPKTTIPDAGEVRNNYLGTRLEFSIGGRVGKKKVV